MARIALSLALAVVAAAACDRDRDGAVPAGEARELLENRNWMDAWPRSKDERLHVFRLTPQMGGGVYQDRTLFRGSFELFTYEIEGSRIRFRFPDSDETVTSRFSIERIGGPEPFDLRLTLDPAPRGPSVLYGRRAETSAGGLRLDVGN